MIELAIVVPTKNRHNYLKKICQQFSNIVDNRIKLYVHDNSDEPLFDIESIDERIVYTYNNCDINMHQNFQLAYESISNESNYVIFIGDDDFVTSNISSLLDTLEEQSYDCVVPDLAVRYWWPDVKHRFYKDSLSGQLRIPKNSLKPIYYKEKNTIEALDECFEYGGTQILMLPKLYHGIVKKDVLDKINTDAGLFNGPTPDMASAVSICYTINKFYRTNLAFLVSGTASSSGGGAGIRKEHLWTLDELPWFDKKFIKKWSDKTPKIACGPTLWSEGVMQVSREYGNDKDVNFPYLYAKCIHESKGMTEHVIQKTKEHYTGLNRSLFYLKIVKCYVNFFVKRLFAFLSSNIIEYFGYSKIYNVYKSVKDPISVDRLMSKND